jgi:hypothetical protein
MRFVQTSTPTSAGQPTISFYAWDQSSGTAYSSANVITRGNSTAFSSSDGQAFIKISAGSAGTGSTTNNNDQNGRPGSINIITTDQIMKTIGPKPIDDLTRTQLG